MGEYVATISWKRNCALFSDNNYSRAHQWDFDGGATVAASASPHIVPLPHSVAENVDPEEAFVAALASCHMLFFLSIAMTQGYVVDSYVDHATGLMGKNTKGKIAVTDVTLRPEARYSGDRRPDSETVRAMHHEAHELCFIANSVTTSISTKIVA